MTDAAASVSALPAAPARPGIAAYNPLGIFRLLLALLVVLQHVAANNAPPALHDRLTPFEFGSIAVYVFFVLSGFIIAEAARISYEGRPFAFLANRLLRIVPSYLVALAVSVGAVAVALRFGPVRLDGPSVVAADLVDPRVLAANLFAIVPFVPPTIWGDGIPVFIPIVWAIRVELLFYAVYFAVLLVASLLRIPVPRLLAVVGVAAVALAVVFADRFAGRSLENIPFFVVGVAAHRLITGPAGPAGLGRTVAAALFAAGLALSLHHVWSRPALIGELPIARDMAAQTGLFLGLLAAFITLASLKVAPRAPWAIADRRLGEYTYPIYLNHIVVVMLAAMLPIAPTTGGMLAVAVLSIGVSCLVALPTEPVIARLRDRVRGWRLG